MIFFCYFSCIKTRKVRLSERKYCYSETDQIKFLNIFLEDDYTNWLSETKELVKSYDVNNEYLDFESKQKIENEKIVQEYRSNLETKKGNLKNDVMKYLLYSRIPCFDAMISESGCLWISTVDGSENPETIGKLLVNKFGQEYNFGCVTVFDANQKELGRYSR